MWNVLAKFQLFCSITCRDILYFVFWFAFCHTLWRHQYLVCIIQKSWISLERDEIWQKRKRHSSSLLEAVQIRLLFNTPIFHVKGTLTTLVLSNILVESVLKEQESSELLKELIWFSYSCQRGINFYLCCEIKHVALDSCSTMAGITSPECHAVVCPFLTLLPGLLPKRFTHGDLPLLLVSNHKPSKHAQSNASALIIFGFCPTLLWHKIRSSEFELNVLTKSI